MELDPFTNANDIPADDLPGYDGDTDAAASGRVDATPAGRLDRTADDLRRDVEALLFASGAPLSTEKIAEALATVHDLSATSVEETLVALSADFPAGGERGIELAQLAGGWAFRTNPRCRQAVEALFELPEDAARLSPAAMEVLAIIAYLQPVSRPQISEIRGVNSDSPLRTLADRELITEVGRAQSGGGAVLYGTTTRFEIMFGLAGVEDLPDLEGFSLGEEQKEELRRRLGLLGGPE
jgi:segregation and condensation protein B